MRALFVGLIFSSIHANAQIIEFKEDKSCVPETDNCFSTLKIKSANKTVQVDSLNGPFFLSRENDQVFGCGGDTFSQAMYATLTDQNGVTIKYSHIGPIIDCGISDKGRLYWFVYERKWNSDFEPTIYIIDNNAKLLHEQKVNLSEKYWIVVGEDSISINTPKYY